MKLSICDLGHLYDYSCLMLTVLIKPYLGYVAALQEAYNANVFFTKRVKTNDPGLISGVPGSKLVLGVFFVSSGILDLRRYGAG